jgi:hypothetical protein
MDIYVDRKPENCNHCIYRKDVSRYLDIEDYCILNKKNICVIAMDMDCPLPLKNERIRVYD